MYHELAVFLRGIFLGCVFAAFFDLLRACRKAWDHKAFFVAIEDFVFWMVVAVMAFVFFERYNGGVLRGYVFLGYFVGAVLYLFFLHKIIFGIVTGFFRFLLKGIKWMIGKKVDNNMKK